MLALLLAGCNKPSGEEEKTGGDEKKTVVTGVYTYLPEANENSRNSSITLYDDGTWKYSGNGMAKNDPRWNTGTYTVSGSEVTLHCKAKCYDREGHEYDGVTHYEVFSISNEGDVSTWTYVTNVYRDHYDDDCDSLFEFFLFNDVSIRTISTYESMTEEQKLSYRYKMTFKRSEL